MAARRNASPPGRMGRWRSARAAVSVRRGSTSTIRPPRARMALSLFSTPGAVMRLPFETSGFAPRISRKSVRSMSGIGRRSWWPNMSSAASICGSWSTEVAEKRLRLPRLRRKSWPKRIAPWLWTVGLPW